MESILAQRYPSHQKVCFCPLTLKLKEPLQHRTYYSSVKKKREKKKENLEFKGPKGKSYSYQIKIFAIIY